MLLKPGDFSKLALELGAPMPNSPLWWPDPGTNPAIPSPRPPLPVPAAARPLAFGAPSVGPASRGAYTPWVAGQRAALEAERMALAPVTAAKVAPGAISKSLGSRMLGGAKATLKSTPKFLRPMAKGLMRMGPWGTLAAGLGAGVLGSKLLD